MKHLLSLKEQSADELRAILELAMKIKADPTRYANALKNETMVMLFQKTSTRTRLSFEAGMTELGGHAIFLDSRTSQLSLTDFRDEIQAIMRYCAVLMFRPKKHADAATAASFNAVPVIDACSEKYHPCQALADLLTMAEKAGGLEHIKKIAWLGPENNVSNTLKLACAKLGIMVAVASPEKDPNGEDAELDATADATGNTIYTKNVDEALAGAQFIHTDTWMNMEYFGEDGKVKPEFQDEYERRKKLYAPYQVNAALVEQHAPDAKIMHCMPCHVGYEISRDAIDHPNSVIFDQAENRLHAQKGIILWLLGKD
ncbi:MAG: ornithine carbamoyltransferase [Patescibacteria group bacterium]|jgi:ornithine carbamoyltransferase